MVSLARRVPGGQSMSAVALSEQQRVAVEARGEVVVAAGAGTGKTTLVIERVRSALELGTAPERVLVVTYTEAAARELALRLERALPAGTGAPRPQVGTIHALAARLLREYASEAGLPAELRVLDEAEALVLSEAAFGDAIARERRDGDSVVLDLLGEYGVDGSRALIRSLDARLRAAGAAAPQLPPPQTGPTLLAPLREAAQRASAALAGDDRPQAASDLRRLARIDALLAGTPGDRELLALAAPKSEAAGAVAELLATAQLEARARLEHEVGVAVATLLAHYREAYRARKEAELALDFDDLQERACELLERPEIGRRGARALRPRARGRVPGHERPAVPAAGRARRPRLPAGLRGRRVPVHLSLPLRRRRALPRTGRGRRAAPPPDRELSLAARAAGGDRPRLRPALRRARLRAAARPAHCRGDHRARDRAPPGRER